MKSKRVTCTWEFYRDNCDGFKEPMRKELRKLDGYVSNLEAENAKLREQTEMLVTLLRNDCDIEASWDGLRKFWNIGLTENGCLMRDRACKAEAENEELRDDLQRANDAVCDAEHDESRAWDRVRKVEAENAKLRELVDYITPIAWYAASDNERDRMYELGIEVDK